MEDEKGFVKDKLKLILMNYAVPLDALDRALAEEIKRKGLEVQKIEDYTANSCEEALNKVVKFMEFDKARKCRNTLIYLIADRSEAIKLANIMIEYMA